MTKATITILALIAAFAVPARALEPVFANRSAGELHGKNYVIAINRHDFQKIVNWKPGDSGPMISPNDAWKAARAEIRKIDPDIATYDTDRISLERLGHDEDSRYIYEVQFIDFSSVSHKDGDANYPNQISVWVTTDGKVFVPRLQDGEGDQFIF